MIQQHPLMRTHCVDVINAFIQTMEFQSIWDVIGAMDQIYAEAQGLA